MSASSPTSGSHALSPALIASLGPGQLRAGSANESIDGIEPRLLVTARCRQDVSTIVNEARASNLAIIPCGGGNRLCRGNTPRSFDIRLSLTGLANVTERRSEDMTVTVEAGVTLAQLNRTLASGGQRLALDPALPQQSSIGGIVAANSSGGLAHGFGTPRDLVLGMSVVDGGGRSLELGGRVVKNVAGYDLARLFTGSWGSLGIITEVTFRTHPLAEQATTLCLSYDDSASLNRARAALFASELPVVAMDFSAAAPPAPWLLRVRIEGTAAEIDYQIDRVGCLCKGRLETQEGEWLSSVPAPASADLVVVAVTQPALCVELARTMLAAIDPSSNGSVGAHAGLGVVQLGCHPEGADHALALLGDIQSATSPYRPRLIVNRCPLTVKTAIDVWGEPPGGFSLMRAAKMKFDPDAVLSPGRFVGRL